MYSKNIYILHNEQNDIRKRIALFIPKYEYSWISRTGPFMDFICNTHIYRFIDIDLDNDREDLRDDDHGNMLNVWHKT